jgi:hypothetical protein
MKMDKYKSFLDDEGTYGLMKPINLKEIIRQAKKEVYLWSEEWFDEKRKSNEMWRLNQNELTDKFLDELKKHLGDDEK